MLIIGSDWHVDCRRFCVDVHRRMGCCSARDLRQDEGGAEYPELNYKDDGTH